MATNNFLPFAIDPAANVISQGAWNALLARTGGFTAGVAQSNQLNKVWRQSSVIAALIGRYVAEIGGLDALDDGDVTALLDHFVATLRAQAPNYFVAGGSANTLTVTFSPAFVNAAAMIGVPIRVKIASANTGAATLNGYPIVRQDSAATRKGDLQPGIREMFFDGTSFRLFSLILQTERTVTLLGRVTAQYATNGVETAIEWAPPAAGTDPLGWYNPAQPTRLTCPAGIDRAVFSFSIGFEASSVGYRKGRVVVNGTAEGSGLPVDVLLPNASDLTIPNGAGAPYPMAAGDYAQVLAFTNPGGPHLLRRQNTFFSVSY
ncbi:conserved hypothetical protein [Bosea sp. 62]|uniref:hypothetical protein n=1 Tax=unclassified Bosea (in: a-proteobacteria) TaxID=2653178 RepID=UPI0012516CB8|nr:MULTISPECIES: hypothetical protein [unclassified Bosea (in: a-proteobacteria)]CAD5254467.1 conserved hypothetical protein [Bosea sp. 7B]CAD5276541.1 conserved hypothetical protein [Bosea sp. 21B]CAD5277707.1 conserved hypothetical protein [Bosea sp. 46]VVT59867.1 conserved hypothetical protein [Bosea sp. EC-HK365B]VXB46722.1 conserved hypothetical protein [Bosea sp. 62]